jgi:uncharacterized membrane protein
MHRNVNDWERLISVSAGAGLLAAAALGLSGRRPMVWTGLGLVARGLGGVCPVNAALGRDRYRDYPELALAGPRGIRVNESIVIDRPAPQLFTFWRDLRNLPHVVSHVERIDVLDDRRSHWVLRGPAGIRVSWDAEILNEVPSELIAWRSLPGSDVASAGSVRFQPTADGAATEVRVKMQYEPPGGKLGASIAWLAGQGPAALLREDLQRFKQLLENGTASETNAPSGHWSWLVRVP